MDVERYLFRRLYDTCRWAVDYGLYTNDTVSFVDLPVFLVSRWI